MSLKTLVESDLSPDEILQEIDFALEATTSVDTGTFIQHDFKLIPHTKVTPEVICNSMYEEGSPNYQKCIESYKNRKK